MSRVCKHQPAPTEQQREWAREIAANGGSLTADELAHSHAFDRVGMAWTRARALRMIATGGPRWEGAHAHADGSVWVPR